MLSVSIVDCIDCVDSEIEILMALDRELGYFQDRSSSRVGESMLRLDSVPNILCAFDNPLGAAGDLVGTFSFVDGACLRPGTGNENFEVRPIVSDNPQPQRVASTVILDVARFFSSDDREI
jgi:hypothetical protein